jgi:hypothetical protein
MVSIDVTVREGLADALATALRDSDREAAALRDTLVERESTPVGDAALDGGNDFVAIEASDELVADVLEEAEAEPDAAPMLTLAATLTVCESVATAVTTADAETVAVADDVDDAAALRLVGTVFDANTLRVGKAVADTESLSLGVPLSVLVAAGERETLAERDPEKEADDE